MSRWVRELAPKDKGYGHGWCGDLDKAWRLARKYVVMSRLIATVWGPVEHVCIRNRDNTDIPWAEKQRIKNELFGRDALAIEVYPRADRLVDEAGMYHLWVLPKEMELPFGLHTDDKGTEVMERG